ncbi:hypothetical protein VTN77DRAFT_3713 [Rasamsonia byssochlamydoides]|uniref:uncharacterized protein n=1 Tax=Rasamsonia byssochlamydoides TaxID=89139 RepID=UPI003743B6B4
MGLLRNVALAVLGVSFLTFVALFGRLPAFRRTPIGFLHRVIWVYIPNGLVRLDSFLLGGRALYCWNRSGRYLMRENHPLVLVFFVAILSISEILFVPDAWPRLGTIHRLFVPVAIALPYIFLYAGVVSKSFITPENIQEELKRYPFDRVLFHPGNECSTCHLLKPARSKHCSLCKACISRHDHHCVWLNNCVGRNNYHYFLALLLSLSVLLLYGVYLGYTLLDGTLQQILSPSGTRWSKGQSWSTCFHFWALAIADDIHIGTVFLLAMMTAPLALGFFSYHLYLVWAGTTTNETAKWDDWKADIADGLVFKAKRSEIFTEPTWPRDESIEPKSAWPGTSDQMLILTDGEPPRVGFLVSTRSNSIIQSEDENAVVDPRWVRVKSLKDVDNIYDLGFWRNLLDALKLPVR